MDSENEKLVSPTEGEGPPHFTKTVGGTTYEVTVHFSKTSKETMADKLLRLIQREAENKEI